MKCSKLGCPHEGTRQPVLLVNALGFPGTPPAKMEVGLLVCEAHATADVNEYVTDEGWARIQQGFTDMGRALPDRSTLRVEYVERTALPVWGKK